MVDIGIINPSCQPSFGKVRAGLESALAPDGAPLDPHELHMRAVARLVGAEMVTRAEGAAALAHVAGISG